MDYFNLTAPKLKDGEVELFVWKAPATGEASVHAALVVTRVAWESFLEGKAKSLPFSTGDGRAVWEVFHLDESSQPSPATSIQFNPPPSFSVAAAAGPRRNAKQPDAALRRAFSTVSVGTPENTGHLVGDP